MSKLFYVLFFGILFTSCATSSYQKLYPKALSKGIDFNMSLADFNQLKGTSTSDMNDESFRYTYVERISNSNEISDIVYYFDVDGDQPLYEMIFIYKTEALRDAAATKLLGAPNNDEEWKLEMDPYDVIAWKYNLKLVMAALIPDTEWEEEFRK